MDKRYQVFVSSTFADLQDERRKVIQTLMEIDCIPAGMEIFPSIDQEQFDFIKTVIDDCDYYIIIIGGRYGSLSQEGISYTEQEYDYAVSKDIKVLSFLHKAPETIPRDRTETDPELHQKLIAFREKVATGRLVKFWGKADELPGLVATSLLKTIKMYPAVGWVRADRVAGEDLLAEMNKLRKENDELKSQVQAQPQPGTPSVDSLAGLDELFQVKGRSATLMDSTTYQRDATWRDIFTAASPYINDIKEKEGVLYKISYAIPKYIGQDWRVSGDVLETIMIQFLAIGLIRREVTKDKEGKEEVVYFLTEAGERLMYEGRAIKTKKSPEDAS